MGLLYLHDGQMGLRHMLDIISTTNATINVECNGYIFV